MPQTGCMHNFVQFVHHGIIVNAHHMAKCIAQQKQGVQTRWVNCMCAHCVPFNALCGVDFGDT